jgi:hypothetical protein
VGRLANHDALGFHATGRVDYQLNDDAAGDAGGTQVVGIPRAGRSQHRRRTVDVRARDWLAGNRCSPAAADWAGKVAEPADVAQCAPEEISRFDIYAGTSRDPWRIVGHARHCPSPRIGGVPVVTVAPSAWPLERLAGRKWRLEEDERPERSLRGPASASCLGASGRCCDRRSHNDRRVNGCAGERAPGARRPPGDEEQIKRLFRRYIESTIFDIS